MNKNKDDMKRRIVANYCKFNTKTKNFQLYF